jgi:hypothetical protein
MGKPHENQCCDKAGGYGQDCNRDHGNNLLADGGQCAGVKKRPDGCRDHKLADGTGNPGNGGPLPERLTMAARTIGPIIQGRGTRSSDIA